MANFYLVCGISGGGKSVLTEKLIQKNPKLTVFDVDKYYEKINGDERVRSNTFEVWMTIFRDLHNAELADKDVIFTTNALTVAQRRQFIEWFPTFNHHLLWVTAPKEKCLIGNRQRKRHLPEKQMISDWERMEFPNANEADWDTISQITNCWDDENYIIFNLKGDIESFIKI